MENDFYIDSDIYEFLDGTVTPTLLSNVDTVINALHYFNYIEYEEAIDEVISIDQTLVDKTSSIDIILHILKVNCIKLLNDIGILLDDDLDAELTIANFSRILNALYHLDNMSQADSIFIDSISDDEIDDVDKVYLILMYYEPDIDIDKFRLAVRNIAPRFFTFLSNKLKEVNEQDGIDKDIINTIIDIDLIVEELSKFKIVNIPSIISNLTITKGYTKFISNNYRMLIKSLLKELKFVYNEYLKIEDKENIYNLVAPYLFDLITIYYIIEEDIKLNVVKDIANIVELDNAILSKNIEDIINALKNAKLFDYINNEKDEDERTTGV